MTETSDKDTAPGQAKRGWFARLRDGLSRSSGKLTQGIADLFTKRKLDHETVEELEELLIAADLGPAASARLSQDFAKTRFGKDVDEAEVRGALAEGIAESLRPVAQRLEIPSTPRPYVVLVVGVNGVGKTTTIGKLAKTWADQGYKVAMAAGDTFRAAAIEQLKIWAERAKAALIARETGADAAAVAYEAVDRAAAEGADILLVDTAGRLHNRNELMDELAKVRRVIDKRLPGAPHATLLVLDATTGQNALSQAEVFQDMVNVSGLVVTKLDGTAKGGVLVSLAERFKLPVYAIGVGESAEDLRPFEADAFARSLMGLPPQGT